MKNQMTFGVSDIATLIAAGYSREKGSVITAALPMGSDGRYFGYIADSADDVPEDAELVLTASGWLRIYDDEMLTASFRGDTLELWLLTKGVDKAEITILVK